MTTESKKLEDVLVEGVVLNLDESKGDGRCYVRGEFGHSEKPTANGRLYGPKLWESQISKIKDNLSARKVLGELDHPGDGRTALQRASHVITDLRLHDGVVIGEAEILDTAKGRDLKAILKAGVPVGISSRGYGSTKTDSKGVEVVQEDYKLVTFDFVAEPADDTAYPQAFFEGVEFPMDKDKEKELSSKFASTVVAARKEGEESTEAVLRKEFASDLMSHVANLREEIEAEVREQYLADPSVARSKVAIESIVSLVKPFILSEETAEAVSIKDKEIEELKIAAAEQQLKLSEQQEMIDRLSKAVKEAGYRFRMEQLIGSDEDADVIRESVGDVAEYDSIDELSEAIAGVRSRLGVQRERRREREREITERESSLRSKNEELAEGLQTALQANKQMALQLYAERRLANHPDSERIRVLIEHTTLKSKEQIDDLLDRFRDPEYDPDDLETVRENVRARLGGGREHLQEHQPRKRSKRSDGNYNNLGSSLAELRSLSGLRSRE